MADRPRRSRRQPQELPGHGLAPAPVALPEVKLDYGLQDDDGDAAGQTSEFVKRLHNMLEQNVYPGIIEWTQGGDAFVVKDMGAFITTVTPRQFKHSNFASFVRQLNKYDFHKIKASEADAVDEGKQAWVFRHPHFRAGGEAKLDLIKRKTPSQRKANANGDALNGLSHEGGDDMREELDQLRVAYQSVSTEMASMQRAIRQQKQLIATLYTRLGEQMPADPPSPDLPKPMAQLPGMQNAPLTAAQAAHGMAPRPTTRPIDLGTLTVPSIASTQREWDLSTSSSFSQNLQWRDPNDTGLVAESSAAAQARAQRQQQQQQQHQQQQLQPQHSQQHQQQVQANQPIFLQPQPQQDQSKQLLTVPGNASAIYTPMWSTKPRVLLVDDDAVTRTISSKFLSVLGCSFDTAQDGVVALELINQSRYDLVLMDIVMPRLDGLQATTKIRQFDARTPIISMTGNSHPADVVKYMSHGMNDVLCKPFTRDGLVTILEKHLIHLRAVWDLRSIPRSPGLPPMSDVHFSEALAAAPLAPGVNLLASNGVPDEQFASLVQGYQHQHQHQPQQFGLAMLPPVTVTGKRGWDAAMELGRPDSPYGHGQDNKRPRFELIE